MNNEVIDLLLESANDLVGEDNQTLNEGSFVKGRQAAEYNVTRKKGYADFANAVAKKAQDRSDRLTDELDSYKEKHKNDTGFKRVKSKTGEIFKSIGVAAAHHKGVRTGAHARASTENYNKALTKFNMGAIERLREAFPSMSESDVLKMVTAYSNQMNSGRSIAAKTPGNRRFNNAGDQNASYGGAEYTDPSERSGIGGSSRNSETMHIPPMYVEAGSESKDGFDSPIPGWYKALDTALNEYRANNNDTNLEKIKQIYSSHKNDDSAASFIKMAASKAGIKSLE